MLPCAGDTSRLPFAVNRGTLAGSCAAVTAPLTLPALMAYGVGVMACRGATVLKVPLPLVRTASSSQRFAPGKFAPKSTVTVNRPLLTAVALRSEEHTSELQSLRHLVC